MDHEATHMAMQDFWRENNSGRQIRLVWMFEESFLFDMLPAVDSPRYYTDLVYRLGQHVAANDILEREIGCRPYPEGYLTYMKGALEIRLGGRRELSPNGPAWIHPAVASLEDLPRWIDHVASLDLRSDPVPDEWRQEKESFETATGRIVSLLPSTTGPVTLAGTLLGQTQLCMWVMDAPELMQNFFEILCAKQIDFYTALMDEEIGEVPRCGVGINDDCCCLFSPNLYECYCVPYLQRLFDAFAPTPECKRRQHSDSAMGHLMPILNGLGINEVNFGPSLLPSEIRQAMPSATIHGQMPPMLLRNGSPEDIDAIVTRDAEALGKTGWCESPAGVVVAGTPYGNLRAYMHAVSSLANHI
jgi:uroporphyrinogen decarboxylase